MPRSRLESRRTLIQGDLEYVEMDFHLEIMQIEEIKVRGHF
jgi:hypothetical protein